MSLRQKVTIQIAAMLIGALLISIAALWGINGLEQDYDLALSGYEELREVYGEVGAELAIAKELMLASPVDRVRAARHVESASNHFELFQAGFQQQGRHPNPRDVEAEAAIRLSLEGAMIRLKMVRPTVGSTAGQGEADQVDVDAIEEAQRQTGQFATRLHMTIRNKAESSARKRGHTIVIVAMIGAFVVVGAVALGVMQYRGVVSPLQRLTAGVRKLAAGEFDQRLNEPGTREFKTLANEFNRMAGELDGFYHRLEEKVAQKGRELTRTERLASVGYLAAGVAHEINNPIGIIAGYAEYSLSQLKQQPSSAANEDLAKSLQIILDEAFRCKEIVGQLLSLTRPGEAPRTPVDLAKVARDVIAAVGGLRDFKDRRVSVSVKGRAEDLIVNAAEAEMKQVVLNLTVNAMDAVPSGGEVRIEVERKNDLVELRVRDNGRGMTPETLDRVFEPFYTEKRGARQPGSGLGLSISNAIIESHGGHITASSAGPGTGSEFLVQLPAAATQGSNS